MRITGDAGGCFFALPMGMLTLGLIGFGVAVLLGYVNNVEPRWVGVFCILGGVLLYLFLRYLLRN